MNIYACLVHESPECVLDLVRNLRHLDPHSQILLYDGSRRGEILRSGRPFAEYGAVLHPAPVPQVWGRLHGFALDCMQFALDHWSFETLTIVDSDQLAMRPGYSACLRAYLQGRPRVGMLGKSPDVFKAAGDLGPVQCALEEVGLWRPFLRRFPQGEAKFPFWTFWPSTVFTADAARDLVHIFRTDRQLQELVSRTKIFATEEVILPSVTALLGYEISTNPCSYDYVQYRVAYTLAQVDLALGQSDVFWMHSIPRELEDPLRRRVRERLRYCDQAGARTPAAPAPVFQAISSEELVPAQPILDRMRNVRGWLEDDEATLLIGTLSRALVSLSKAGSANGSIVEVGSFEGKATVVLASVVKAMRVEAKVYGIDPHDGKVGALDRGLQYYGRTYETLLRNIAACNLGSAIEVIPRATPHLVWDKPIWFLLIDHLHDYASVSRDFYHFEPWLAPGGYVAFHDYADYYPGVKQFVSKLQGGGCYQQVECVQSMMVLQKMAEPPVTQLSRPDEDRQDSQTRLHAPAPSTLPAEVHSIPLVSCLMPTANRRAYVPRAIEYFLRQTYANRELIIVDDGEDPVDDLIPADARIRYVRLPQRTTIGAKHNLALGLAHGDILLHWDDDDWMADWRVTYQVAELLRQPEMTLSGLARMYFYEPSSDRAWEYIYNMRLPKWISGGTFCYRRRFWESHPFPEMNEGGDTVFVWNLKDAHVSVLEDNRFYVATVHAGNTSPKRTHTSGWQPIESQRIQCMMDEQSWSFYRTAASALAPLNSLTR